MVYAMLSIADRHLVRWLAPEEVHTLVLAVSFGSAVFMLKGLIGLVWDPRMVDWIATRDPAAYEPKLQHGATLFGGTLLSLAGLAAVWSDWVVDLLYPGAYTGASALIPVLALAGALSTLSLVGVATALVANVPRFHLPIYTLGLGVNVAVGLVAIPRVGALGAALGTLAAEGFIICAWVFIGRIVLRNLRIRWRLPALMAAVTALAVAFYRPGMLLPDLVLVERFLASAAVVAFMGTLVWWGRPAAGWRSAFAENEDAA
jgi:O-antigen/teichoic acid export membrane protein